MSVVEQREKRIRRSLPYLLIGGAVLYLCFFTALPLTAGVWLSFTDTSLLKPWGGSFVGTRNFERVLSGSGFWNSVLVTLVYAGMTVLGALVFGTLAALAVNRPFRGRTLARGILVIPWALPAVAAALVFTWIYNMDSGPANGALAVLGIAAQPWLVSPDLALWSVVLASIWKVFPFVMLVVLAALQSVPEELREASRVDGASALNTFRSVTLPHISPTLKIVGLLMTIWSLRRFELIYLLTGGGPAGATDTLVLNVYREAFQNTQLGVAATVGTLGLLLAVVVTIVYFLYERRTAEKD